MRTLKKTYWPHCSLIPQILNLNFYCQNFSTALEMSADPPVGNKKVEIPFSIFTDHCNSQLSFRSGPHVPSSLFVPNIPSNLLNKNIKTDK